jgi:hypothetical protein
VVAAVANHLASSSYHEMEWEEAQQQADNEHFILEFEDEAEEVEQEGHKGELGPTRWSNSEVDQGEGKSHKGEVDQGGCKSHKGELGLKSLKGEGKGKGGKGHKGNKSSSAPTSGSGGRQHETRLSLRSPRRSPRSRSPRRVSIRASQLQTILDSLERAAQASEYSATLSRTAAKAFEDQAAALRASQRLMQEALLHSTL